MSNPSLEGLVNKDKYQVFVFSSPSPIPLSFARHTWLVVNKIGVLDRYEVFHFKNSKGLCANSLNTGYLYKNYYSPFQGIGMFFLSKKRFFWHARLECEVNCSPEIMQKLIGTIENSMVNYPYINQYFPLGPNSNTYPVWILSQFPEIKFSLPANAIGKNFTFQKSS